MLSLVHGHASTVNGGMPFFGHSDVMLWVIWPGNGKAIVLASIDGTDRKQRACTWADKEGPPPLSNPTKQTAERSGSTAMLYVLHKDGGEQQVTKKPLLRGLTSNPRLRTSSNTNVHLSCVVHLSSLQLTTSIG